MRDILSPFHDLDIRSSVKYTAKRHGVLPLPLPRIVGSRATTIDNIPREPGVYR